MSSYELYLPPEKLERNAVTGRYMKGHVPHNKGKKWDDYTSKRAQRGMRKGWKNLDKHRPKTRPDNAGRCRKQVIAVLDDGRWVWFPHIGAAAEWIGGRRDNVSRCCRMNQAKKVCKHNWRPGQPEGANPINTDHKYKGIRFYFESDNILTTKINK